MSKFAYRLICLYLQFWDMQYLRDNDFLKSFGNHLRKVRKEKKFTQEQLANDIGVEISQISRIERGILNTSISTVNEIAKALNIPLNKLFEIKKDE